MTNSEAVYPPERKALYAALVKAQGEFPPIARDKTVNTGSYSFSYAPLETIIEAIRPVLAKHGLAVIQRLENQQGNPAIRTEVLHAEGGCIAASFPLGETPSTIQQLGSKLTYLRRYALCSMLCLAAEDDDDGRRPGRNTNQAEYADHREELEDGPPEPVTAAAGESYRERRTTIDASEPQVVKLNVLVGQLRGAGHVTTENLWTSISGLRKEPVERMVSDLAGRDDAGVLHWSPLRDSLTRAEASQLIEWLTIKERNVKAAQEEPLRGGSAHDPATAEWPDGY